MKTPIPRDLLSMVGGWRAVYVWCSRVGTKARGPQLGAQMLELLRASSTLTTKGLVMGNSDVLVLLRDEGGEETDRLVKVAGDALGGPFADGQPVSRGFDLDREMGTFVAAISGLERELAAEPAPAAAPTPPPLPTAAPEPAEKPGHGARYRRLGKQKPLISPQQISLVEHLFFKADVSNFVRNQTAYRGTPDEGYREAFDELFISIDHLSRHMRDKFKITADRWLFQYLTKTLDARLLNVLGVGRDAERKKIRYSLNLNFSTLMSKEFLAYDASIPPRARRRQTIELQAFDIVENLDQLRFVTKFVRQRGYHLAVDSIDDFLIGMVDWSALGVDTLKLAWNARYANGFGDPLGDALAAMRNKGFKPEIVLCRCDDETAIHWGLERGITTFQGWHFDGLAERGTLKRAPRKIS